MSRTTVKVEGLQELDRALADLGKSLGAGVLRRVAREVLTPVADQARATVEANSKVTGALAESITVGASKSKAARRVARATRKAGRLYVETTVSATAPHAHLIEFGTGERFHESGKGVGRVEAEPFMRPAWDGHKSEMPDEVGKQLWAEIEKTAKRKAKRDARKALAG